MDALYMVKTEKVDDGKNLEFAQADNNNNR